MYPPQGSEVNAEKGAVGEKGDKGDKGDRGDPMTEESGLYLNLSPLLRNLKLMEAKQSGFLQQINVIQESANNLITILKRDEVNTLQQKTEQKSVMEGQNKLITNKITELDATQLNILQVLENISEALKTLYDKMESETATRGEQRVVERRALEALTKYLEKN